MTSTEKKLKQIIDDIEEAIAGCPSYATKSDKIAAVSRHVRIKKETIKKFL